MGGDVVSLATQMTPYVSAAVGAYGGAVLARVQDEEADATVGLGCRLLQRLFGSRNQGEPLPGALAELAARPEDEDAMAAVRLAIRKILAADPGLEAEMRSMLANVPMVSQQIHAGRDVYAAGRDAYAVGRDLTVVYSFALGVPVAEAVEDPGALFAAMAVDGFAGRDWLLLVQLLHDLRMKKEGEVGALSLKEIAARIHARRLRTWAPGHSAPAPRQPPPVSSLWRAFNGLPANPELVYDLVRMLGGTHKRGLYAQGLVEQIRASAKPQREPAAGRPLGGVVEAVLACLPCAATRAGQDKLRLAVEVALGRAIAQYATANGKTSLAGPLLWPRGFLAQPGTAEILAATLAGRDSADAGALGHAWAQALLAGTRVRDMTEDARDLLGYLASERVRLIPLHDLTQAPGPGVLMPGPDDEPARQPGRATVPDLVRAADKTRAELADVTRLINAGTSIAVRDLPPLVRVHLYDQTALMAASTRDFTGRQFVFDQLTDFIEQDQSGYCFVQAHPGVGKTALLSSFIAANPHYARHFNVLTDGVITPAAFLKNICAQLIGGYGLPYDEIPDRAAYDNAFLVELLDRAAHAAPGKRVIVAVDALDEALTRGRLPGVNPLYLPRALPDGCRLIVTVRKDTHSWQPQLDPGCLRKNVIINEDEDDNMDDVRAYIRSRAGHPGIIAYLGSRRIGVEDFAGALAAKSQGNFMYLRHILPQYEKGGALTDGELAELPEGLIEYYVDQYERLRGDADEETWRRLPLPVLTALAKARRPVTAAEIAVEAGVRPAARVRPVIREWLQFLVEVPVTRNGQPRTGYRIFHASFQEFLRKKTKEDAQADTDAHALLEEEARQLFFDDDEDGQDG